jgi:hypothetical protein
VFTMCFVVFTVNIIKWSGSHNTRFYTVTTVHNTNRNSRLSRVFSSGCRYNGVITKLVGSDRQMAWFVSLYFLILSTLYVPVVKWC